MPRPRFEKLTEEKRETIIAAAARDFAAQGYSGASLNRIIERAGISKGAMYYYFDDKEDLFLTVLLDLQDTLFETVGEFPGVSSPVQFWNATEDYFGKILSFAVENPLFAGLLRSFNTALARDELKKPLRVFQKPHFDFHKRFIRIGQSVGAVRTDLPDDLLFPLLEAIDQAGDSWFAKHFEEFGLTDLERIRRIFHRLYRRILEPEADSREIMR